MKLKLPKDIKGFSFPRLFSFEMNEFEVEALLPALFYLIRSGGRGRGKLTDPTEIEERRDDLANHQHMVNFDDAEGRRVLDKWIRTSLIDTARRGRSGRGGEQIFYVKPLTFLSYKPGFPAEGRRVRAVPAFIYHILKHAPGGASGSGPMGGLRFICDAFAEGVELEDSVAMGGRYDGKTSLDVETLGQLHYLDGFKPCPPSTTAPKVPPPKPALARAARRIASDVDRLVRAYRERVPSRTLAEFLTGLLNFQLFVYTLELQHVVNRLVDGKTVDPWWDEGPDDLPSPVRFYVDFVGDRGHLSARMSQEQVEAHFAAVQRFFRNSLLLRTLHRSLSVAFHPEEDGYRSGKNFSVLLGWKQEPTARARATHDWQRILDENGIDEHGDIPEDLSGVLSPPTGDEVERLVHVLEEAQRSETLNNILQWYRSVGGLVRNDGILAGNVRGRRAWRLQMSEGLLEILVQLCCVTPGYAESQQEPESNGIGLRPRPVSLGSFLRFLEERYGIIVDRPPEWMQSVETVAAAKENLEALKRRLRQMGVFEDLSDDFNAQYIEPRYATERGSGVNTHGHKVVGHD